MWPFDRFRKRKHDRRYRAALVVYLGTYLPDRLDAETRRRVEIEVTRIIDGWSESGAAFRRWAPWKAWGSARAVAMANIGVEPTDCGAYVEQSSTRLEPVGSTLWCLGFSGRLRTQ